MHLKVADGTACEGSRDDISLSVSQPARVQVYSVDRAGGGHFLGAVEGGPTIEVGDGQWVPQPDDSDERLVAVAVPLGQSFGARDSWSAYCRLPTALNAKDFPAGAAVGTKSFLVYRQGTHGCPAMPEDDKATVRDLAAVCGE